MRIRFEPLTLEQILPLVLEPYENQQRRILAEFGGDEDEVRKRVERMRAWAEFCCGEHREVMRVARFNELFGRAENPKLEAIPGHKCELCGGAGIYWSSGCTPRRRNSGQLSVDGFIACRCAAGVVKNRAIGMHGRNTGKSTRRGVQTEEW